MAFIFEDQPQASGPQFVFDDAPEPVAATTADSSPGMNDSFTPQPVKQNGILAAAADTFTGAAARVAEGVNSAGGAMLDAFGMEQGAQAYKEGAEYWDKVAQEAGSNGLPAEVYKAVGAAPLSVSEFVAGPVYSGVKGAVEGYREGGVPGALEKAAIEVTKRIGIGKVFHGIENTTISGLPKAAAMGGTMAAQTAGEEVLTPEGINPQAVATSAITGTMLSVSGGGKSEAVRRALIKEGVQPEIAADLASRVPDTYPAEEGAGRFQFEDQPVTDQAVNVSTGDTRPPITITDPQGNPVDVPLDTRPPESIGPLVSETGNGSVRFATEPTAGLDPERQSFIKDKVEGLGSIEAVDRMHPTDTPSDVYARQVAGELFSNQTEPQPYTKTLYRGTADRDPLHSGGMGKGEYYTSDESIAKSYAEDFSDTPGQVTTHEVSLKKPFYADTLDDVFKILPETDRNALQAKEGESINDVGIRQQKQITDILTGQGYDGIVLKNSLNPRTGEYIKADEVLVLPVNVPEAPGRPNASEPLLTPAPDTEIKRDNPPLQRDGISAEAIQPEIPQTPLDVIYHPADKKIELRFSETPDQKTVNRLGANQFKDQGDGTWIAQGSGKVRREFVEKLKDDVAEQYAHAKEAAVIPEPQKTAVSEPTQTQELKKVEIIDPAASQVLQNAPLIEPGTVEQFTATAKKRGGQEVFDVKLNPSQRRTLEAVRQDISDGEAGKRVGIYNTNEPGSTQVSWGSTFPEYFRDKGYTKKKALVAIDNVLNGDGVTALQKIMVEDMHQAKRHQDTNTILNERAKPSEVSAMTLNEGDVLKRNGEKFKVTDVSPDGVTLKDGVVLDLNHEQAINYDRGTLQDAYGKQKKTSNSYAGETEHTGEFSGVVNHDTSQPRFEQTPAGDQGKLFATPPAFGKGAKPEGRNVSTDELPIAESSIKGREGKQAELFPHSGGVILDSMGLQQIYGRISNARLVRDVMDDVKALGRHVIAKGATTWKEFFQGMKDTLGNKFAKVRPVMEKVWKILDNEQGSVNIEAPRLREAWDGILRAINPMERGDLAEKTGALLRERMGVREMNRVRFSGELDAAVKKYEEQTGLVARGLDAIQNSGRTIADKVFSKMNEQDAYDFMQAVDTGDKAYFEGKPALNDIAAVINNMFQGKVKEIQNLGTGVMQNVRESYFPHIWEKGEPQEQIAKVMGKRPLEGSKGFTKQRVFDDIQTGIDAGFKPVSQNPLDLVFLKMTEMDKYIAAHKGLQAMEESGVVQLIPAGEKAPDGFFDIAGKYGIVTKQGHYDPETGLYEMKSYRYVAADEVAQVFNNYLSPTLYQNKYIGTPFEAYMGAANTLNQFQLGVGSLFHGGFTSLEAVISRFSLGLKSLSTGDLKGAAEYISTSPVAMVTNWKLGQKVLDAMKSGGAPQGEMADVMDWLQLAGARTAQDERFRTDQTQKVLQAWSNGKHFGAVAHSPLAIVEQSSRIILEHIVPQQKMGVFVEMMKQWTDSHPEATHAELRTAAQAKWSRADARLGQVVYERYFIHNAVKNGLQALIRAPGWTGGTILELGGGAKDALESITKLARGEKAELSDRTAYAISLVAVTAIANGVATVLFTGEKPKGMDFLAFRTGNLDEKGKPERFVFPTYMKDLYAYSQAPGMTLIHKAHPVIGLATEIGKNKDYYGTEIRHPGDNPAKQLFDSVFHTAKAFTPFWMRGVAKERERGGSAMAQVAPFFGVMPAPADMNATAAEKKARELVVGKLPQGSRTKAEFEHRQLEHKIETALRKKDPGARIMIQQAKREKLITAKDEQQIRKAATTPPLVSATRSLDFPQALQVWEEATNQEKGKLKQPFISKGERYLETHPDQAKETNKQLREIRRFVGR